MSICFEEKLVLKYCSCALSKQPDSHTDACVHSMFAHRQQERATFGLKGVKVDSLFPELASLCWSLPSADRPLLCPLHLQSVDQQSVRHYMQHILFDRHH